MASTQQHSTAFEALHFMLIPPADKKARMVMEFGTNAVKLWLYIHMLN